MNRLFGKLKKDEPTEAEDISTGPSTIKRTKLKVGKEKPVAEDEENKLK
jgi:hypothetical protein